VSEVAHEPVMVAEVIGFLGGSGTVVDLTLGAGGHAEALLEAGFAASSASTGTGRARISARRLARFGDRFTAVHGRFSQMPAQDRVDGVLYDLGVSSMQLDVPNVVQLPASWSLDMRMGGPGDAGTASAMEVVNTASEEELATIIFELGEERRSRRVAAAIVRARSREPIRTTDELARVVAGALGARRGGPHPARRTFQALRIAVNRELEELTASLPRAVDILAPVAASSPSPTTPWKIASSSAPSSKRSAWRSSPRSRCGRARPKHHATRVPGAPGCAPPRSSKGGRMSVPARRVPEVPEWRDGESARAGTAREAAERPPRAPTLRHLRSRGSARCTTSASRFSRRSSWHRCSSASCP